MAIEPTVIPSTSAVDGVTIDLNTEGALEIKDGGVDAEKLGAVRSIVTIDPRGYLATDYSTVELKIGTGFYKNAMFEFETTGSGASKYIEYLVTTPAGDYVFMVFYEGDTTRSPTNVDILIDGVDTGEGWSPNTTSSANLFYESGVVSLDAGEHVLRFNCAGNAGGTLNHFEISQILVVPR